ncbi:hypothetical protein PQR17_41350, partial [Paraburkholderia sediminicola]
QTLLELLVDTAEQYQQELQCDRELYKVIALDAKGVPQGRLTARHAVSLLAEEVSQRAGEPITTANAPRRKNPSAEGATALRADAAQQPDVTPN